MKSILLLLTTLLLVACSNDTELQSQETVGETAATYKVIDQDLQELKDDFNANQGRVRLMFLSGPTCGICLRGMADLNDEFIAERQNDDRLITFVVHVPALGAKEKHVAETIPLLNGPRIHHYWEDTGIIGQHFSEVMDVEYYVWDFWAIYGPDALWDGLLPPKPDYYEHQLGVTSGRYRSFPKERVLDAERFALKALELVEMIDAPAGEDKSMGHVERADLLADGTKISAVAQPRNVAVRQHIMGRGGYKNLKRIQSVRKAGTITINGQDFELGIETNRPNTFKRNIGNGGALPLDVDKLLESTFEFDGLFVEWPDKGHGVSMKGMRKFNDVLAWKLELRQENGAVWNMYVDSHSGDLIQKDSLDSSGNPAISIRQSDFREVDGYRFPFRTEYFDRNGESIAVENLDAVAVDVDPFDLSEEAVSH